MKMTNNPNSLDKISDDLSTVFYVGIGKKSSQGEPAKDQTREDQEPFFTSKAKQNPIPIFIKLESGTVYYAGTFKVKAIRRKMSPKGFQYYEIVLLQAYKRATNLTGRKHSATGSYLSIKDIAFLRTAKQIS